MRGSSLMYLGRGPPTRGPTVRRRSLPTMRPDKLERRLRDRLDALGPAPRAELLHVLMLPDFERADRIGRVCPKDGAAEVDGGLDVLRATSDTVGHDRDGDRRLPSLGLQRRLEATIGQQRGIDASGQVAQVVQRLLRVGLDLGEHQLRPFGVVVDEALGQPISCQPCGKAVPICILVRPSACPTVRTSSCQRVGAPAGEEETAGSGHRSGPFGLA
jgi:hypothetical protein